MKLTDAEAMQDRQVIREACPRRFKISKEDLAEHGYTKRCPGCSAVLQGARAEGHLEICWQRIEAALKGSEKLKRLDERGKEFIVKVLEKQDEGMGGNIEQKRDAEAMHGDEDGTDSPKRMKETMVEEEMTQFGKRKFDDQANGYAGWNMQRVLGRQTKRPSSRASDS